ncbi:MAG: carbon storage regulator [Pirellulales bacterium]|nr:carbon storage regulator [Pirellulales bacterium]
MRTFDCSEGEGVVIDGTIFIELVEIAGDEVCVKIDLPDDMAVCLREELDAVS